MQSESSGRRRYALAGLAGVLVIGIVVALAVGGSSSGSDPVSEAGSTTAAPADSVSPTTVGNTVAHDTLVTTGSDSAQTTVHEVVPDNTIEEIGEPIGLDDIGDFGTGVTATVVDLQAVEGEARIPGEIAGPAVRAEVRLRNDTGEVIDLAGARIDISYGADRTPGIILGQPDVVNFPLSLEPGGEATAAAVFVVPLDQRELVQVAVWYTVDAPIIVFEGAAPTA